MTRLQTTSGRAALALAVLVSGCAIAACGSSRPSTSTRTSAPSTAGASVGSRRAQLVACLRQHGVSLPSRPPGTATNSRVRPFAGGGLFGGRGRFRGSSKLAAAFHACGGSLRIRGGARSRISHAAIDNYLACVRRHGYPQMPNPNFSGRGSVFPASIRTNPRFEAASHACQDLLRPAVGA